MKIDSSMIGMESARSYTSISSRAVGFHAEIRTPGTTKEGTEKSFSDLLQSEAGEEALGEANLSLQERSYSISAIRDIAETDEKKAIEQIKAKCMQYLIYWLFGGDKGDCIKDRLSEMSQGQIATQRPVQYIRMQSTYSEYFSETEKTSFSTEGKVVTADGREISFNLGLTMSRSFEEYYETSQVTEIVQMMDPLVINLDSNIASLSDQKF